MTYVYRAGIQRKRNLFGLFSVNIWIILITVVLFFVFTILLSANIVSIDSIAIRPSNILAGKYLWTFLTSIFMHAGFFHLFANMFSMIFIGNLVQKIIGQKRFFYFYVFSGLFAGLFFVLSGFLFQNDIDAYAVGASGALFGLVGFLMIITPNLPVFVMFIPIPVKMKYAGPGILIILWLVSITGNVPIGNTAHLGGLIIGLLYGIYLRNKYKNKTRAINRFFS